MVTEGEMQRQKKKMLAPALPGLCPLAFQVSGRSSILTTLSSLTSRVWNHRPNFSHTSKTMATFLLLFAT
jgi:hypothetical protein